MPRFPLPLFALCLPLLATSAQGADTVAGPRAEGAEPETAQRGAMRARRELAAGQPIVLSSYGKPRFPHTPLEIRREELLHAAYTERGIQRVHRGCEGPTEEDSAYGREMYAELQRRFGSRVFEDIEAEVASALARERPAP